LLLVLAACAVAALTGGAGIALILSRWDTQQGLAEAHGPGAAVADACGECGLIESLRVIEEPRAAGLPAPSTSRYETSIRLRDGSSHVIADSAPRAWRVGERVKVIGGAI
jgi:hypothetical protein